MKYKLLLFKRWVEDLLMFPLILLGRAIALVKPLGQAYDSFYFFPFYHIGGAEKVHLNIARATGNGNCIIFFTRKSQNDLFLNDFRSSGCVIKDVSAYTDNKWIYFVNIIFRGILSGYINRQSRRPVVFNGQCNFGYKLSPWLRKDIPQIELIHSLCSFSYIRIPFLPFIHRTVMISKVRIAEHLELYKRYGIPESFAAKIQFILNGIDLPQPATVAKQKPAELTVLYVGRGTPEKRVHLVAEMAKQMKEAGQPVRFEFLGDVEQAIPVHLHPYCTFHGNQSDPAVIDAIYAAAQVLILTSDTEGFPMVVMEAMARGLAIVATAVGEIPLHVKDGVSGFVITDYARSEAVVEAGIDRLLVLAGNRQLFSAISAANIAYAYEVFGMKEFARAYQTLFEEMRRQEKAF